MIVTHDLRPGLRLCRAARFLRGHNLRAHMHRYSDSFDTSFMHIRPATPADIPHMRALEQQADTAAHWAEREYGALFAPEAPKRVTLVAIESADSTEGLAGFLIARADLDEWEIENVVVASDRRRGGIGSALVGQLLHQAARAKATSVLLEVRESNQAARRLYQRQGFIEVGRRSGYYDRPPEDALLFRFSVPHR